MITLYRPLVHLLVHPLVQFSTRQYEIITASVSVWVFFGFLGGFFCILVLVTVLECQSIINHYGIIGLTKILI